MFSCYFSWESAVDRIVMEVKLKGLVQNPYYRYLIFRHGIVCLSMGLDRCCYCYQFEIVSKTWYVLWWLLMDVRVVYPIVFLYVWHTWIARDVIIGFLNGLLLVRWCGWWLFDFVSAKDFMVGGCLFWVFAILCDRNCVLDLIFLIGVRFVWIWVFDEDKICKCAY